jgi:hypothetical protein
MEVDNRFPPQDLDLLCNLKVGPSNSSIRSQKNKTKNNKGQHSQLLPQAHRIRNSGLRHWNLCFGKSPGDSNAHESLRTTGLKWSHTPELWDYKRGLAHLSVLLPANVQTVLLTTWVTSYIHKVPLSLRRSLSLFVQLSWFYLIIPWP